MTLLTCSHCDGPIKPRRSESKARHGRRRYCSRTCSAAGARAAAKAARAVLLRRCEVALKAATRKARDGSAGDVYALKDALAHRALVHRVNLLERMVVGGVA